MNMTKLHEIIINMEENQIDLNADSFQLIDYSDKMENMEYDVIIHANSEFIKLYKTSARMENYLLNGDIDFKLCFQCHVERLIVDRNIITFTLYWDS